MTIIDLLIDHEGLRLKPYRDSVNKLTIGIGRNLDDVGLTENEARYLLANDLGRVRMELDDALPWWRNLDDVRQMVLIDMGFNLGVLTPPGEAKLLTFVTTLGLIRDGRYSEAADQMLKTKWAAQVGKRAKRLAAMMRTASVEV